jgi:AraC-like DNA-binding protein
MTNKKQKNYSVESHEVLHFTFNNFQQMKNCAKNWSLYNSFRYGSKPFKGQYDICQHENFQIANAIYEDGLINNGYPPKDTLTLAVIINKKGSLTANKLILKEGDILIIDDQIPYEIAFSNYLQIGTITISKAFVNANFSYLYKMANKVFVDTDRVLSHMIEQLANPNHVKCNDSTIESKLMQNMMHVSLNTQVEIPKKLSKKTSIVFDIRDYLIEHIEQNISIEELTSIFDMSDKTLQTVFKKIFGHTPKKFMKLLKLNLAYQDIIKNNHSNGIVSKVATKYGFYNFGLFSQEFERMHGVLPSKIGRRK